MKVQIQDRVTVGKSSLECHTKRFVAATLSRYMNRVRRVFVEFSETDGGGYGVTTRCFVRVETTCGQTVAIDDTRNCAFLALEKALRTVKRMVTGPTGADQSVTGALQ